MTALGADRPGWSGSLRVRVLAVVIGLLLLSSLGSVLLLRTALLERLDAEVEDSLSREVEEFRLLSVGNDPQTGRPFDGDLQAIFDVYFAREVPDEGESLLAFIGGTLYASRRAQDAGAADELGPVVSRWQTLEGPERGVLGTGLGEARYVALPVDGRDEDGLFVVANFPDFEREEINDAVGAQVVAQLATLVVASALGLALAGRALRPLRTLASTARSISDTDLTRRITVTGRDEASQIAVAFNDMLTRLEGAFTTQRQFLDDTSHELRTPLTVIRGHLELIGLDSSAAERADTIALVTDEIDRMTRIVNDLFLLARAERADFLHVEPIDLREVAFAAHHKAVALADRQWLVSAPAAVPVLGDRQRLMQAVLQLADNATKFTTDGQVITLGATALPAGGVLWVHDSGTGVAPEVAERIFQRFHRGSAHGDGAGAGLGLAIVAAIAEAHGGGARLVPQAGPGARFEITVAAVRAPGRGATAHGAGSGRA